MIECFVIYRLAEGWKIVEAPAIERKGFQSDRLNTRRMRQWREVDQLLERVQYCVVPFVAAGSCIDSKRNTKYCLHERIECRSRELHLPQPHIVARKKKKLVAE